jgi:hypothetical protein
MISKERAEGLRDKLIVQLVNDLEGLKQEIIEESWKDPLGFLYRYIHSLKKDIRACRGNRSADSYVYIDYPLSKWDFTEEELKYFKFYE